MNILGMHMGQIMLNGFQVYLNMEEKEPKPKPQVF